MADGTGADGAAAERAWAGYAAALAVVTLGLAGVVLFGPGAGEAPGEPGTSPTRTRRFIPVPVPEAADEAPPPLTPACGPVGAT